jgi:hypothetical protein
MEIISNLGSVDFLMQRRHADIINPAIDIVGFTRYREVPPLANRPMQAIKIQGNSRISARILIAHDKIDRRSILSPGNGDAVDYLKKNISAL